MDEKQEERTFDDGEIEVACLLARAVAETLAARGISVRSQMIAAELLADEE